MENVEQEKNSKLKLALILFYLLLLGLLMGVSSGGDVKINLEDSKIIAFLEIGQAISVVLLFLLPAVLFAALWTKPKIHYLGITTKPSIKTMVWAGIGILVAVPLINWLADMNSQMQLPAALSGIEDWMKKSEAEAKLLTDALTKGTSIGSLILNLFVIAFLAAVCEEIFFRGMLQKVIMECVKNKHIAIWIGAILFSAFHMEFYGFVPRMLMGAYLGYLFYWSGSLMPGILAHFLNNGMQVFLVWLGNRGTINADAADKIGVEDNQGMLIVVSILMVAMSLFLVYKIEKKRKKTRIANIQFPTSN